MADLVNTGNTDVKDSALISLANGIEGIYQDFAEKIHKLGAKKNGRKMVGSVAHWIAGSHVKTERDLICEGFINSMQSHLELFDAAMEGADPDEIKAACSIIINRCSQPVSADSNSSTDLMKRAMISQVIKYLPYASKDEIAGAKERLEKAYSRWNRLPVEKEFLKEADRLLKKS